MESDLQLFLKMKNNDLKSYEILFKRYYSSLCYFATSLMNEPNDAEDIVQEYFLLLWQKRKRLSIVTSVKSYFFRSIRNRCINYLKQNYTRKEFKSKLAHVNTFSFEITDFYLEFQLKERIAQCIQSMPEKQRTIFVLSKEMGKKNAEIAELLSISIKTVEAYITKAFRDLRVALKDYKELIISFSLISTSHK